MERQYVRLVAEADKAIPASERRREGSAIPEIGAKAGQKKELSYPSETVRSGYVARHIKLPS